MKLRIGRPFLQIFLPLALLVLGVALLYALRQYSSEMAQLQASETQNVSNGTYILERRIQVMARDLNSLATHSSVRNLLRQNFSAEAKKLVEEDFRGFSHARQAYDKVRLLDLNGQEIVRVDFKNGRPQIVDRSKLLNKADRYYFGETLPLPPGVPYISPADLEVNEQELIKPLNPLVRASVNLADAHGNKRAMLVLNHRFDEFVSFFHDVTAPAQDHLWIVNDAGYFLHAPNPDDCWGFMFNRPDLSLPGRYPESWASLQSMRSGHFIDRHGLWTVDTVALAGEPDSDSPHHWKVVAHIPTAGLPTLAKRSTLFYLLTAALVALGAALAYLVTMARQEKANSDTRLKLYFEHAMVGMAICSPDYRWRVVNPALCQMLGYSAEQLHTLTWYDITLPEDRPRSEAALRQIESGQRNGFDIEKRYLRSDGEMIDVHLTVQAMRQADGGVDSLLVIMEDITARRLAEQSLRNSEERMRAIGDNLPESYVYQCRRTPDDEQLRFTYVSNGVSHIHGLLPEQIVADPNLLFAQVDPAQAALLQASMSESRRTLRDFSLEVRIRNVQGEWRWLQLRSRPRPGYQPDEMLWDGVAVDITSRRSAQEMIERQMVRTETLLELPQRSAELSEADLVRHTLARIRQLTASQLGCIHFVDDTGQQADLLPLPAAPGDRYCSEDSDQKCPLLQSGVWREAIRRKAPLLIDERLETPAGTIRNLVSLPVLDSGRVEMMVSVGNKPTPYTTDDVETIQLVANTLWRLVQQARSAKALMVAMQVVNASPIVCFRWRAVAGWPVVFVSDNVANWGYRVDDLLAGKPPFAEMVHPDDLARVVDEVTRYTAEGRSDYLQEYRLLLADGQVIWVSDRTKVWRDAEGKVEFYDGILTDISERRQKAQEMIDALAAQRQLNAKLEEAHNQLLQSEKMASIGQLAAGIAHELNNPIGFVHSNLGTLENYLRDVMEIIDAYDQTLATGGEPAAQVARMTHLKAERDFNYLREDIGQLLSESKDGLSRVRKIVQDLKNFSHVSEQEWQWADLHQGLESTLNIVWNELKYKCQVVKEFGDIPEVYCLISQLNQVFMNLLVNAGHAIESKGVITIRTRRQGSDAVCIEISDTGKGIAPEHLNRIFEPFFTTKPVGKGTGLGLSLAYGIVDKHHGHIEVESQLGSGTTFRVILPIGHPAAP